MWPSGDCKSRRPGSLWTMLLLGFGKKVMLLQSTLKSIALRLFDPAVLEGQGNELDAPSIIDMCPKALLQ